MNLLAMPIEVFNRLWSSLLCSGLVQSGSPGLGSGGAGERNGYGAAGWAGNGWGGVAGGWWWIWLIAAIVIILIAAAIGNGWSRGRISRVDAWDPRMADGTVDPGYTPARSFAGVILFVILVGIAIAALVWWGESPGPNYANGVPTTGSVNNPSARNNSNNMNGGNNGSVNGSNPNNMGLPGGANHTVKVYGI